MKCYIINLEKAVERKNKIISNLTKKSFQYQIIPAVDGSLLTDEDYKSINYNEKLVKN